MDEKGSKIKETRFRLPADKEDQISGLVRIEAMEYEGRTNDFMIYEVRIEIPGAVWEETFVTRLELERYLRGMEMMYNMLDLGFFPRVAIPE